jgi:IclR family pca regulon transcriptional regulator
MPHRGSPDNKMHAVGPPQDKVPAPMSPNYQVGALSRGLRILSLFSDRRESLMLKEITALTEMPMPTVFRLAATLEADGYLERLEDGSYRPGLAVLTLGFAALRSQDALEAADQALRKLANEIGQTVNMATLRGTDVLYLIRVRNDSSIVTANLQVGSTLPAIHTSIGKLLLAFLDEQALTELEPAFDFAGSAGPNAVRSLKALRKQLTTIRKQGYAIQDEEVAYGLRSVAAPIKEIDGRVQYAVNIAVPAAQSSVEDLTDRLLTPLQSTCAELSLRLESPARR